MNAETFRTVLDNLEIGVCLLDRDRRIVFWNQGAEKITGYQRYEVIGHPGRDNALAQCNDAACLLCGASCPLTDAVLNGKHREIETQLRHKAGHRIPVQFRVNPVRDGHGAVTCVATSFFEDHETTGVDLHRTNLASHGCLDVLTGLPNHVFTNSHLRENLFFFQEHSLPFGVLGIRIDGLKELRASHGREAADIMLHVVAQSMKHALRPDGFLGRWAEEEFLGIITYCDSSDLTKAAEKVERMVSCSGVQWWDDLLTVSLSIGHAMVQASDTLEALLERVHRPLETGGTQSRSANAAGSQS